MMACGWYMMQPVANQSLQLATTDNTREEILPDGSKVFLNYNSSLTYPQRFDEGERKVTLKGEAFFDIQPDAAHPFIIDANGTEVKVLGTSFNVKAYAKEPVRVDVETGRVSVTKGETNIKLSKGESAVVVKDTVKSVLPDLNKMGYRTQVYDFVATDLEDVVSSIRNGYHIDLRLSDEKTAQCRLTIRFEKEPVDATLGVIAETMNLKIRKEGEIYWLDGNSCQ
jgi:ferric-dicitrate binding protein FerR (iron transport regulator)